jgi:hypothetical protein
MAIGYEIVLGFTQEAFNKVEKALGTNFSFKDEMAYYDNLDDNMDKLDVFMDGLNEAYIKTLKEVGFEPVNIYEFTFKTPLGVRKFSPFRIETYFDSSDIGDKYKDIVIGISLSGRYKPVLLDWENEKGSLKTMVLDEQMQSMVEIAKKNISDKISVFESASTIIKLKYY